MFYGGQLDLVVATSEPNVVNINAANRVLAMDNHQLPTSSPNTDVQNAQFDLQVNAGRGVSHVTFHPVYLFWRFCLTMCEKAYWDWFLPGYSTF